MQHTDIVRIKTCGIRSSFTRLVRRVKKLSRFTCRLSSFQRQILYFLHYYIYLTAIGTLQVTISHTKHLISWLLASSLKWNSEFEIGILFTVVSCELKVELEYISKCIRSELQSISAPIRGSGSWVPQAVACCALWQSLPLGGKWLK